MDEIKRNVAAAFSKYLNENNIYWRTFRISTFVDLVILEAQKSRHIDQYDDFTSILNLLLAAKINIDLGVIELSPKLSDVKLEKLSFLNDKAIEIITSTFNDLNEGVISEIGNPYNDLDYFQTLIRLKGNQVDSNLEKEFIQTFCLKLIAWRVRRYFN